MYFYVTLKGLTLFYCDPSPDRILFICAKPVWIGFWVLDVSLYVRLIKVASAQSTLLRPPLRPIALCFRAYVISYSLCPTRDRLSSIDRTIFRSVSQAFLNEKHA